MTWIPTQGIDDNEEKKKEKEEAQTDYEKTLTFLSATLATKKSQRCVGVSAVRAKKSNEERALRHSKGATACRSKRAACVFSRTSLEPKRSRALVDRNIQRRL